MLEKNLMNRTSVQQVARTVCLDITRACLNTDPRNVTHEDKTVMINGQPVYIKKANSTKSNSTKSKEDL